MKIKALIDLRVICDPPHGVGQWCSTQERRAKALEQWAEAFNAFIKDHRSQDGMYLFVQREHEDQCSHCGQVWEEDNDTGEPFCCDMAQQEWAASQVTTTT